MSAGIRVAAFAALLGAIFAIATLAGAAIGPDAPQTDDHGAASATDDHGADSASAGANAHGAGAASGSTDAALTGLGSSQDGYRLVTATNRFAAGRGSAFAFSILDDRGDVVRDFEPEQRRRMHLIVVRRDLRGYQHLHPVQDGAGGWRVALTLPQAGVYRAIADFRSGAERRTLGVDLFVPGDFAPRALAPAQRRGQVAGYSVALEREAGRLRFAISRAGEPVADLQRYLGAYGHLVVLREGDLAYGHVHPVPAGTPGQIAFETGALEPGRYRLFVQFRHAGAIHTAAFTFEGGP